MKVKVFEADTMSLALRKVKEQLGSEALILSTRTLRRNKRFGFPGKSYVEVTAAVDKNSQEDKTGRASFGQELDSKSQKKGSATDDFLVYNRSGQVNNSKKDIKSTEQPQASSKQPLSDDFMQLQSEIYELKQTVQEIKSQKDEVKKQGVNTQFSYQSTLSSQTGSLYDRHPILEELGLHSDFSHQLIRLASLSLSETEIGDYQTVFHFFQDRISEWVSVNDAVFNGGMGKKRIAMVGPTGVGKTTTLAKLAAQYMLYRNKDVAMVTIDNYRIAAVEQLKVYGQIMNIPVEVAFTSEELGKILDQYQNKDLVLIDTAGRSPRNDEEMHDLRAVLDPFKDIEAHLVLSATTREEELFDIIKSFDILSPKSTIFTKVDECDFLGSILNVHFCHEYPISYLAKGQRVPEDLLFAEPKLIAELVMKNSKGKRL